MMIEKKVFLKMLRFCNYLNRDNLLWGHSTTTWTKFYPILTPSPSSGQTWTFYILSNYPLSHNPWKLSTDTIPLFLSTQVLNAPYSKAERHMCDFADLEANTRSYDRTGFDFDLARSGMGGSI